MIDQDQLQREAQTLYERGRLEDALDRYNLLLKLRPADPELLNDLGTVCFALGRTRQSARCYLRALELDAAHALARSNLRMLCASTGRSLAAIVQEAAAAPLTVQTWEALKNEALELLAAGEGRLAFRHVLAAALKGIGHDSREFIREQFGQVALRLCVVMDTGIGNMVMLTPALRALRGLFPAAEIEVVGRHPALEVVGSWPQVDACTELTGWDPRRDRDAMLLSIWSNRLCKLHAEAAGRLPCPVVAVANPYAHNVSAERFVERSGWPAVFAGAAVEHEVDFHLEMARTLGFEGRAPAPHCPVEAVPFPFEETRRVVLLADTADLARRRQLKRWPHFRDLAARLLSLGWQVGLVGGEAEAREFNPAEWPDGVVSLLGGYSIPQTAYLIKRAGLLIANDSGPAHLGAAVGAAVHVLFGPTSETKNRPTGPRVNVVTADLQCRPCQHAERWLDCDCARCMEAITVEHVMDQVLTGLPACPAGTPKPGTLTDPDRYLGPDGYDAERYWSERLGGFGLSLRGAGNKRLSEAENEQSYREAEAVLLGVCRDAGVDLPGARVLDVGCGTGFYAGALRRSGVRSYLGIDITDALFEQLRARLAGHEFRKLDVSREELDGCYELVLMIDVTQHITSQAGFAFAMGNVRRHLAGDGAFVVTSWLDAGAKRSFYEASRPMAAYLGEFAGWQFSMPLPFRDKFIFSIRPGAEP